MNLLLDTNVIIDYLGRRQPFFENAERVMALGFFGDATLWAPAQSFKDAFYVLSHYVSPLQVQGALLKLLQIVHPVDLVGPDIVKALRMQWDDMEDCLVAVSAYKCGADYLVTRDLKGFSRSMVPAISPDDFLEWIRAEKGIAYDSVALYE